MLARLFACDVLTYRLDNERRDNCPNAPKDWSNCAKAVTNIVLKNAWDPPDDTYPLDEP
jgi:hypothetical protein